MAKVPETRDRIRVWCEIDVEAMGPLIVQLARMGIEHVGHELITDVVTFNKQKKYDVSADNLVLAWVNDHPTFEVKEVVHYFRNQGRNGASAYRAVRNLVESGAIVKTGVGSYARSDVKAIAPPQEDGKQPRASKGQPLKKFPITGQEAIWRHIKNRQKFTVQELQTLFRAQDRNPHSVSPLITRMLAAKQVKMIEPGKYAVLKKPVQAKKKAASSNAKNATTPSDSLNGQTVAENSNA